MIANPARSIIVSSLGWVDHDALWLFDTPTDRFWDNPARGARYVSVPAGGSDRFSVGHHFDGRRFEV